MEIRKLTRIAVFAALSCVLTMFPQIQIPTGGYVHFGDSIVYIAAAFLGPLSGAAVGAVGHSLADILTGHIVFAMPTFIIKGIMGFVIGKILYGHIDAGRMVIAGIVSLAIVTLGYFVSEALMFGVSAAMLVFISSPAQWLMSVIATIVLAPLFKIGFKA